MRTMLYDEALALHALHVAEAERGARETHLLRDELARRAFFRRYKLRRFLNRVNPALAARI